MEVVAFQDAGHREIRQQLQELLHIQIEDPLGVVAQDGLLRVEHLEGLVDVGLGILLDLLAGKLRARRVAAGRIADERGAVADDEGHLMPQILELAQLAQGHRVTQMDIGGRRIDPKLHVQRHAALELLQKRRFGYDLGRTGFDNVQLFLRSKHGYLSACRLQVQEIIAQKTPNQIDSVKQLDEVLAMSATLYRNGE